MTSRPPVVSPGNSGSVALALHPPSIDLSNKLLSSAIPLPPDASVAYAVYSPTTSPTHHRDTIELARRRVLDTKKPSLLDSLLCTVHVDKGGQQLYVFSVFSSDVAHDPYSSLNSLQLDGLICKSSEYLTQSPRDTALVAVLSGNCSSKALTSLTTQHRIYLLSAPQRFINPSQNLQY
jgi:mediator complex subunit 13